MYFDLISDLHVDRNDWFKPEKQMYDWESEKKSDTLVIAGDMADGIKLAIRLCGEASEFYDEVIIVDGNHEHFRSGMTVSGGCKIIADYCKKNPKVKFLNRQHGSNFVKIGSCAFIGANGWYNFGFDCGTLTAQQYKWKSSNDAKYISWDDYPLELANKDTKFLADTVRLLQHDEDITSIVVVTHTMPIEDAFGEYASIDYSFFFNLGQYINSSLSLVWKIDTKNKIKKWCFGHTHAERDFYKHGIHFIANPRGYKYEEFVNRRIIQVTVD